MRLMWPPVKISFILPLYSNKVLPIVKTAKRLCTTKIIILSSIYLSIIYHPYIICNHRPICLQSPIWLQNRYRRFPPVFHPSYVWFPTSQLLPLNFELYCKSGFDQWCMNRSDTPYLFPRDVLLLFHHCQEKNMAKWPTDPRSMKGTWRRVSSNKCGLAQLGPQLTHRCMISN